MRYLKTNMNVCSENEFKTMWLAVEGNIDMEKRKRLKIDYLKINKEGSCMHMHIS